MRYYYVVLLPFLVVSGEAQADLQSNCAVNPDLLIHNVSYDAEDALGATTIFASTAYDIAGESANESFGPSAVVKGGDVRESSMPRGPRGPGKTYSVNGTSVLSGGSNSQSDSCFKVELPPPPPPPSPICQPEIATAMGGAVILGLEQGKYNLLPDCPSTLARTDTSESGMPLILEDWTIFSANGRSATPLATVSKQHANSVTPCYSSIKNDSFLVINQWEHPTTHPTYMPRPNVSLNVSAELSALLRRMDLGRLFIRIEVGESERVRDIEVLYSPGNYPTRMIDLVRRNFRVDYNDDRRHRFSYYAVLETGGNRGSLADHFITLPRCGSTHNCE